MALDPETAEVRRLQLQSLLEVTLGSERVYFQPPSNVQMQYPCVVYKRDSAETAFAGNKPYRYEQRYLVTFIAQEPNLVTPMKIAAFPTCTFVRHYAVKNLNHDVFVLYY